MVLGIVLLAFGIRQRVEVLFSKLFHCDFGIGSYLQTSQSQSFQMFPARLNMLRIADGQVKKMTSAIFGCQLARNMRQTHR